MQKCAGLVEMVVNGRTEEATDYCWSLLENPSFKYLVENAEKKAKKGGGNTSYGGASASDSSKGKGQQRSWCTIKRDSARRKGIDGYPQVQLEDTVLKCISKPAWKVGQR